MGKGKTRKLIGLKKASGCWDNWILTCKKVNLGPYLTLHIKINSNDQRTKFKSPNCKTHRRTHRNKSL